MDRDKMIDYIVETETTEEIKADLKNIFKQIEKAKDFMFNKYFDIEEEKWLDEDFEKVYNLLSWNNKM